MKFSLRSENKNGWGNDPWVIFADMAGRRARFNGTKGRLHDALARWVEFAVPVAGDGAVLALEVRGRGRRSTGRPGADPRLSGHERPFTFCWRRATIGTMQRYGKGAHVSAAPIASRSRPGILLNPSTGDPDVPESGVTFQG